MSCDVVVVGGGISGMYMAETLMRMKKEDSVCLFEKDSRFGGRIYDYRFSQAPNISISKLISSYVCCHPQLQKHDLVIFPVFGGGVVFVVRVIFSFLVEPKEVKRDKKLKTVLLYKGYYPFCSKGLVTTRSCKQSSESRSALTLNQKTINCQSFVFFAAF